MSRPRAARRRAALIACLGAAVFAAWALDAVWSAAVLSNAQLRYGEAAHARAAAWLDLITRLKHAPEAEKLQHVNNFFNRLPNVDDAQQWGERDYWATPLEMLGRNGGDCEDFAIAKYFTLRALGVDDHKLQLSYVKAYVRHTGRVEPHMVIAYRAEQSAEPLLLDNLQTAILPASRRQDLAPTYSFPADQIWTARQRSHAGLLDGPILRNMWYDLRELMAAPEPMATPSRD